MASDNEFYVDTGLEDYSGDASRMSRGASNQSYHVLVWRKFRRSFTGMLGLMLVASLLFISLFADFFAPVDPKHSDIGFAPPDKISFYTKANGYQLTPVAYPIVESTELDPVTFQPLSGPDLDNPRPLHFFVNGYPYRLFGLVPMDTHFFGVADSTPVHLLGSDKLGRDDVDYNHASIGYNEARTDHHNGCRHRNEARIDPDKDRANHNEPTINPHSLWLKTATWGLRALHRRHANLRGLCCKR